jgi:hypothetical protein
LVTSQDVILYIELRRVSAARKSRVPLSMRRIPLIMTSLAQGTAPLWIRVALIVIHVRNG